MADKLVVATPWFPTANKPYAGAFVGGWLQALNHPADDTLVIHLENVSPGSDPNPERSTSPVGDVLRIPVPVSPTASRTRAARSQLAALEASLPDELVAADIVHAHVGMPTAWAVAQVVPTDARFVVTEHASYLAKVLRDDDACRMYGALVDRAARVLTASEWAARNLRATFPRARGRITSTGNPVATDLFPLRPGLPAALRRWLYVGNLIPAKGVDRVISAFAQWTTTTGGASKSLTLVGQGSQEEELRGLAEHLGVTSLVTFAGPVDQADLYGLFERNDLLVHLSHFETFGLTAIEAAVSGLPVVVTTCFGPEETLGDAAADGMVRFVPVERGIDSVVSAVKKLEDSLPILRPGPVRAELVERFGYAPFGRRLRTVLDGGVEPPAKPSAPTVVALALSPRATKRVIPILQSAIRAGARTVIVTNQAAEVKATDPRTRVVDLHRVAKIDPVRLLDLVFLKYVTRAPVAAVERILTGIMSVGGRLGGTAGRWREKVRRVELLRLKVENGVRSRILYRFYYGWMDPWRLGIAGIRRYRDEIARDGIDIIVLGDDDALPLAWQLARRYPDAGLSGAVSGAALNRLIAQHSRRDG